MLHLCRTTYEYVQYVRYLPVFFGGGGGVWSLLHMLYNIRVTTSCYTLIVTKEFPKFTSLASLFWKCPLLRLFKCKRYTEIINAVSSVKRSAKRLEMMRFMKHFERLVFCWNPALILEISGPPLDETPSYGLLPTQMSAATYIALTRWRDNLLDWWPWLAFLLISRPHSNRELMKQKLSGWPENTIFCKC